MKLSIMFASVIAASAAVGCAKEGVVATEPQDVQRIGHTNVAGPFVEAGTTFSAIMLDRLSTESSVVGEPFRARVERDLTAPNGSVVVRAGSIIEGKIARVDSGETPVLALDFQTVGTTSGDASIAAKLEGAQQVRFFGSDEVYDPATYSYDAFFYPPGAVSYPTAPPPGYYPGAFDYYDENAAEIAIPANARIKLQLTRAIIPPSSHVR